MFGELLAALDARGGRADLASLRFAFTAGAAIPVELIHAFESRGVRLKQGFGQTETSILCCLDARDAIRKAGSVGKPVFHVELRIVARDTLERPVQQWRDVGVGQTGEIVVRGPITMTGYWQRPAATAETLREDGWLRTGDLATCDEEGFVTLVGRARDLFISGGENVYPAQVEQTYQQHPDVAEIAVVGVADARWGEVGRAYVVPAAGVVLDVEALRAWGRERLASFKVPHSFVAVASLPHTVTGKIQKHRIEAVDDTRR
jgi:fatty-acyl-CoA synthase